MDVARMQGVVHIPIVGLRFKHGEAKPVKYGQKLISMKSFKEIYRVLDLEIQMREVN